MDTTRADIWLEIVLLLDTVNAIRLRKTCSFFKFIDKLYFLVVHDGVTSSIYHGRKNGWSWRSFHTSEFSEPWWTLYKDDVVVEHYMVAELFGRWVVQINEILFSARVSDVGSHDLIHYNGPQVMTKPLTNTVHISQTAFTNDNVIARSPNFLNMRDNLYTVAVIALFNWRYSYCVGCHSITLLLGTCCNNIPLIKWADNSELILMDTKVHYPNVYALLPHD
jgi:hypothetical protein